MKTISKLFKYMDEFVLVTFKHFSTIKLKFLSNMFDFPLYSIFFKANIRINLFFFLLEEFTEKFKGSLFFSQSK